MFLINNTYWILTELFQKLINVNPLGKMKMILDEMCDNYASEYDPNAQVQRAKTKLVMN